MAFNATSSAVAAACLLATLSLTNAHAAISAQVSFSDLRLTLIDDNNGGSILPLPAFNPTDTSVSSVTDVGYQSDGQLGNLPGLPLPSISAATSLGSATLGGTGGSASATLGSSNDLTGQSSSSYGMSVSGTSNSMATIGYDYAYGTQGLGFPFQITLGAGTTIVLEGSYATSLNLSQQQVADLRDTMLAQKDPTRDLSYYSYSATARAGVGAYFYVDSLADPSMKSFGMGNELRVDNDLCTDCSLIDLTSQASDTFSFSYTNTTGGDLDVNLLFLAGALVDQTFSMQYAYVSPPVVPGVPEPSTYALMGLGLVGLGWAHCGHARR